MIMDSQRVKYTKTDIQVITYDTGLSDWHGIENVYAGASLRDKVVARVDMTQFLTEFFSVETVTKYRPVLMMIAKAQIMDPNKLSAVILDLLRMDKVFANKIHYLFHSCPEDISFGVHIIQKLADTLLGVQARYRSFFTGRQEMIICNSDGWLYLSFNDSKEGPLLPDNVKCEVLSYAKSWDGNIRYFRSE